MEFYDFMAVYNDIYQSTQVKSGFSIKTALILLAGCGFWGTLCFFAFKKTFTEARNDMVIELFKGIRSKATAIFPVLSVLCPIAAVVLIMIEANRVGHFKSPIGIFAAPGMICAILTGMALAATLYLKKAK
ncbi:hypothetical protein ACFL54_05520 [Planctomycetota bacterium]